MPPACAPFPGPISITALDGSYVSDLLPSTVEAMAAHPEEYQVLVPNLAAGQREFLDQVAALFGSTDATAEADPVRRCHDALVNWRSTLPHSALSSRYLSVSARSFGRLMTAAIDPYRLLFEALPRVMNVPSADVGGLLHALSECTAEIEGVLHWNYEAASRAIRSAFPAQNGTDTTPSRGCGLVGRVLSGQRSPGSQRRHRAGTHIPSADAL